MVTFLVGMKVVELRQLMTLLRPDRYRGLTMHQFVNMICPNLKERLDYRPRSKGRRAEERQDDTRKVRHLVVSPVLVC